MKDSTALNLSMALDYLQRSDEPSQKGLDWRILKATCDTKGHFKCPRAHRLDEKAIFV
jgi:hypothetical protein